MPKRKRLKAEPKTLVEWRRHAIAMRQSLATLFGHLTNYQNENVEEVLQVQIDLIKEMVDDSNPMALCHSAVLHPKLYALVSRTCKSNYDARRYAREKGYDVEDFVLKRDWKLMRRRSMLVAQILRLRSEHIVPTEHIVLAVAMKRAGASKRVKGFLTNLSLSIAEDKINQVVSYFLKNPFQLPSSGTIGLGVYDNASYTRKFVFERVGDHEKNQIHTVNSLEIPIGMECAHVHSETRIWSNVRYDLWKDFEPDGAVTRDTLNAAWESEFPVLSKHEEPKDLKAWDYPVVNPDGKKAVARPQARKIPVASSVKPSLRAMQIPLTQMARCLSSTLCTLR
jgi:hypothetical protein